MKPAKPVFQVGVSVRDLNTLAERSINYGTQDAFIRVALEWAAQAEVEIEKLRKENAALMQCVEPR